MSNLAVPPAASLATGEARVGERLQNQPERWIERRVGLIWALLFFNGLTWQKIDTVVPIPKRLGQLLTMGALGIALVLAIGLNRRLLIRPNLVLGLYTFLAAIALISSLRAATTLGPLFRSFRLAAFIAVLWLLTPWWGRRDMLLTRCHLRALLVVSATVLLGLVLAPSTAFGIDGRLAGTLWPIWPTAVAHYGAVAAGIGIVLWLSGLMPGIRSALLAVGGTAMVLLSHTRIALVALVAGLICAGVSLFLARVRVRRVVTAALIAAPLAVVALAPVALQWFTRGQTAQEIASLTGRKQVWDRLLEAPRPEFNQWFGFGLSDKGFEGLAIDSTWLSVYQDEGLVGVIVVAAILFVVLITPAFREAGPARAVAVFLVVYCAVDSYTEVGLADATPYMLDLIAAASLLIPRAPPAPENPAATPAD